MKDILKYYGIPKVTVNAVMIAYINTRSKVRSPDGDTTFFEITAGVLRGDILAPFFFIICLNYIIRKTLDQTYDLGFTLIKKKTKRYNAIKIIDVDYSDDIAVSTYNIKDATSLFHKIEEVSKEIGIQVNMEKTEYMNINQANTENLKSSTRIQIKRINDFKYLGSYVSSTEKYVKIRLEKAGQH